MNVSPKALVLFALDGLIAVAWAAALASLHDIQTSEEWAVALGATFLAGLLSGRYRILALAVGGTLLVVTIIALANPCQASTCEETPIEVVVLFVAVFAAGASAVMALGVFVRQLITGGGRGSWASMSEP
jgi:hypothetical protein